MPVTLSLLLSPQEGIALMALEGSIPVKSVVKGS
jgi:hypothetical protein